MDVASAARRSCVDHAVQVHVAEHALGETLSPAQEAPHVGGLHALEVPEHEALERHGQVSLEQQRIQKCSTELPIARPRLTARCLERANVDERGGGAAPLDVEGVAVLHRESVFERRQQDLELQCGCVLEHRERPLVRIRHKRDPFVLEERGIPTGRVVGRQGRRIDRRRADHHALRGQRVEEVAPRQRRPVGGALLGQRAEHPPVRVKNRGGWVAK